LNDGKIIHSGSASELAKDETRVRALAGAGASSEQRRGRPYRAD
jgi:hypothetical protein